MRGTGDDVARRRAEMPAAATRILEARSLYTAHRRLAAVLTPGLAVLDVGCGVGAITRGIAEAVGPAGRTVGVDCDLEMIRKAQVPVGGPSTLWYVAADIYQLPFAPVFDVVTASRVVQWLADPLCAVQRLAGTLKPRGRLLVLDYNHERIRWVPDPPRSMQVFYARFLSWRAEAGFDNAIADHLADLARIAGLGDIRVAAQHELVRRGDPTFMASARIWGDVAATRGRQMVADGWLAEDERAAAEHEYGDWVATDAESQALYLLALEARR